MLTIGIDPGLSGALALLDEQGSIELLADLPIIRDRSLAWVDGSALQGMLLNATRGRPCHAFVERVGSRPGQGVSSAFQFGCGFGSLLSIIQARGIALSLTTPVTWKRSYGLDANKAAAFHKATLLFPGAELHLAKHIGRAEALLIAEHGRRTIIARTIE